MKRLLILSSLLFVVNSATGVYAQDPKNEKKIYISYQLLRSMDSDIVMAPECTGNKMCCVVCETGLIVCVTDIPAECTCVPIPSEGLYIVCLTCPDKFAECGPPAE